MLNCATTWYLDGRLLEQLSPASNRLFAPLQRVQWPLPVQVGAEASASPAASGAIPICTSKFVASWLTQEL
ncbi:hypothetical protein PF003_g13100 [Phytophthora fragariae]|nr:hypothetical protein PF003_g13100 [Phytophthora fragariae]